MDNKKIDYINKKLKESLGHLSKRYIHSVSVATYAMALAANYKLDIEKAYIAGLLHDNAKNIDGNKQIEICIENNIKMSEIELENPHLLHAKVGAYLAKKEYGICDDEIENAIRLHTMGAANMTQLEEIIYVSDYIEPLRSHSNNLDELRVLSFKDLKKTCSIIMHDTIKMLSFKNRPVDKNTVEAYEFYKQF